MESELEPKLDQWNTDNVDALADALAQVQAHPLFKDMDLDTQVDLARTVGTMSSMDRQMAVSMDLKESIELFMAAAAANSGAEG